MRRMLGLLSAVALFGEAAAAQSTDQFDLICTGTQETHGLRSTDIGQVSTKEWTGRFSIDLSKGLFCSEEGEVKCTAAKPIYAIEPHRLVLEEIRIRPNGPSDAWLQIRRDDGSLLAFLKVERIHSITTRAKCTVSDFTPLPSTLF